MRALQTFKQVIKQCSTLNDNKTYDVVSIFFMVVMTVGCAMFVWATTVLKLQPDYLQFFSGIATVVAAFGFNKSKLADPDPTKIPEDDEEKA